MQTVLLVVHVLICVALIGVVLIQRSDSDGFGLGSGSGANFMTGRAAANLLTRATAILATLFIVNSLILSILVTRTSDNSLLDAISQQEQSDQKNAADVSVESPQKDNDADAKKPAVPVE